MKRIFLPVVLSLCMLLCSCSSAGTISTYTMDLSEMPTNFDPQVADANNEIMVLTNVYDGLFDYLDGKIVNNVCQSYEVSADGLVYTFSLRKDSTFYLSKTEQLPVTSHDFAFALERVLTKSTRSPYYDDFSHIKAIETPDDYTLKITLSRADGDFLYKLTLPAAYPCNEEFFIGTNGAYGLRVNDMLSNGPYTINYLADDGSYATLIRVDGAKEHIDRIRVSLLAGDTTEHQEYASDKISGFFAGSSDISDLAGTVYEYENTNFDLVFNPKKESVANSNIRGAMAYYAYAMENSGANLAAVNQNFSLFNSTVLFNGEDINNVLDSYKPSYMGAQPKELMKTGLAETEKAQLGGFSILVPKDISYSVIAENINQLWQKNLNIFCTLEYLPNYEIVKRVTEGDFDVAFVSTTTNSSSAATVMDFAAEFDGDVAVWAANVTRDSQDIKSIKNAQKKILEEAYIVPMCTDSSRYIHKDYFANVHVNPYGNIVNLKYAKVK